MRLLDGDPGESVRLSQKIWLGFGLLIVIQVVIGAAAYLGIRTIDRDLRQLADFERPAYETVEQMERSVAGTETGVLAYFGTGDEQYREQVERHARVFEEARDRYGGMVESQQGEEQASRIGDLYGEYEAVGNDLMDSRDSQESKLSQVDENIQRAGTIAGNVRANLVQDGKAESDGSEKEEPGGSDKTEADRGEDQEGSSGSEKQGSGGNEKEGSGGAEKEGSGGSEKAEATARMESAIAEVGAGLGAYSTRPEEANEERVLGATEGFEAALGRFRTLGLTEQERDSADELEGLLEETRPLLEEIISLDASVREDLSRFSGLRADLSETLDEVQQSATRQEVSAVEALTSQVTRNAARSILFLLVVGLVIGLVAAAIIGGRIVRSVRKLAEGATSIASGTLDHHIDVATRDEIGLVASSLNRIAEEREHNEEELRHLGGLVENKMERVAELEAAIADLQNGGQMPGNDGEDDHVVAEGKQVPAAGREAEHANRPVHAIPEVDNNAKVSERLVPEEDLASGIERGELVVHYQPIVSLETLKVSAFEAFLCRNDPGRGLLAPGEFLPLAEETGLILPPGDWALEEACRQARVWRERYPDEPSLTVCVNLSQRQLDRPDLVESIGHVLTDTGLDPRGLVLEITESVLTKDPHAAVAILKRLKGLHVGIAIDGFGNARSSQSRLEHFPVDIVKVDPSLVARIGEENGSGERVSAVIESASRLSLDVIAEGVETYEQLARLQALGCARGQGYYLSRPVPGRDATSMLRSNGPE